MRIPMRFNLSWLARVNGAKVVFLETEFAVLSRLGLPISLSLQLQQSGLKLADALWTARVWLLCQLILAI